MKIYILFIHLFLGLVSVSLLGQSQSKEHSFSLDYVSVNFTTQDGLPSNEVYSVFQDSKGYIWVGTDRGVSKYDGYSFKTLTTQDGLTDNVIFDIAEDSKGRIWFTTSNQTLCYLDSSERIFSYKYNAKIKHLIKNKTRGENVFFNQIFIDERDHLFLAQYNLGYLEMPLSKPGIIKDCIKNRWKDNGIYITHSPQYNNITVSPLIRRKSISYTYLNNQVIDTVSHENRFNKDRSYVLNDSMYYCANQIYRVNKQNQIKITAFPHRIHAFQVGDKLLLNKLDSNKRYGEVFLVDEFFKESEWIRLFQKKIRLTQSFRDINGGIWLSSVENGIFYLPNLDNKLVKSNFNTKVILPYGNQVVFAERDHKYYAYQLGKSFSVLENELLLDSMFTPTTTSIKLSHAITIPKVTKWIKKNLPFSYFGINTIEVGPHIIRLSSGSKLLEFTKDQGLKTVFHDSKIGEIYCFSSLDSTQIIIGLPQGLGVIKNNTFKNYLNENTHFNWRPKDIKVFQKQNIIAVATTGNGLFLFKNGELLQQFTVENGLVSNSINQLVLDNSNRLWIGTNKGINYLDMRSDMTFTVGSLFSSSKSILSPNVQQMHIINDSLLLIGTDKGVNEINIKAFERHKTLPTPIYLTSVLVNDSLEFKHELEHDQNNIVFEYTALEYNQFGDLSYRYRLNGQFKNWIYTKNRQATFMRVLPGDYSFELEVQNEFGQWIPLELPSTFTIDKPYWKTWWFIGGSLLISLFIIGSILYYYISNLKKEKAFVENEQFLSEELNESRQKALSAQLNPHFVFNSLNSIQNFILTKRTELSSDYLSTFSKLMRFVFENSKKLYVPLSDEIEALKLYLELEQVRHNHIFEYQINSEGLKTEDIFIPSLLIQPIIENAIWHGLLHKQEGNRLLDVRFYQEGDCLQIEVKDNGIGRSRSKPRPKFIKKQKSSGVELTQQRLDLLSQSTGLTTMFQVMDLYDDKKHAVGTCVRLSIPVTLTI